MALIIKREHKPRIKKRHLSLLAFILVFTIAIYRACYITYHYRIIKLSTFTVDKIELRQVRSGASSDFQIELSANFSKSYCPLNLEFIEITASAFTGNFERCSKSNSGSMISLSVDKLRLDKKTPLKFSANLRVARFHLESTLLDMLGSDLTIQLSFYVRARFCYVPLYFFKNIVKRRSELAKKSEHSVSSDFLAFRVISSPVSSIQIGLRRRFFTEILGDDPNFIFNIGCLKLDFSGCIHKSILVNSFDTRYYCTSTGDEGTLRIANGRPTYMMKLYVPGVCFGNDVVFFFISIPLYDGESFGKMIVDRLRDHITYLKVDKVSVLVENSRKRSTVCSFGDILAQMLSNDAMDLDGTDAKRGGFHFTEICVLRDMYILNPRKNASGESSMFVNGFELSNRQMSCNIGLSNNHGVYNIIRQALMSNDLRYLYEHLYAESRCIIGGRSVALLNARLTNVPADETFFNVIKLVITFEDDMSFAAEDLRSIMFRFLSFSINGRSIMILNLFEVVVDCLEGIFLKQDERLIPICMFPPVPSRVFRLDHELSDSSDGRFLNICTKLDISTYGSREKAMDPDVKTDCAALGNSFVKIELPNISISATNSFMKLRSKVLPSNIFFIPRHDKDKPSHIDNRGVVEIQSAVMLKKLPPSDQPIYRLMLEEEICIKVSQLATFRIIPSRLLPMTRSNATFVKFLPFSIELDIMDRRFTSFMSSAIKLHHIQETDDHISDYLKCVSKDFPRRHGWNPELCSIFGTQEPTRHFIVNVLHAKNASYAINYTRYTPLVIDGTDVELALVYTGDNLFMYFCSPFDANVRIADPSIYDDPEAFTSEFVKESRLCRLIDFILGVVIRTANEKRLGMPQDPSLVPETIGLSIEANRTRDNYYMLSSKIALPKNVFSWPEFIRMNLLGKFTLHSKDDNVFSLSISLDSDENSFVLEIKSSWGDDFGHEPIELIPHMLGKELSHFNLDIFGLVVCIRKYIGFIVENSNTSEKGTTFDYLSRESISAFFDSGYDPDFIFKEDTTWIPEASSSKTIAPWEWDIEFIGISKKSFGFGLEFKLWSDELLSHVGSVFSHVFGLLPCKIKPGFVDITLNLRNLFDLSIENSTGHKIFGLEKLDITQAMPIKVPIYSRTSQSILEEEKVLFYTRMRNKARTSLDQYMNISMEFYVRGYSTLVSDVLNGGVKLSHSLYEESLGKFGGSSEKNKPFVKLRFTDLRNCFIDLKLPFLINVVGESMYLILRNSTSLTFISKIKGPLLDPKAAASGYNISIPISSRRLSYQRKQTMAKQGHIPSYFRKQCDLIAKYGDTILHCRGMVFSGTMSRNMMFAAVERILSILVPGESGGFLNDLESWIMSSISKNIIRSAYVDCDPSIDGSFAENGFELNSKDIDLLQGLLHELDFP